MPRKYVWLTDADGNDREVQVFVPYEVCPRCEGEGKHGHTAFDGTSMEWWYENDPTGEDLDDYMSGRWDVTCEGCRGLRVVEGHPRFENPQDEKDYWRAIERQERDDAIQRAEIAAEQAFESRLMGYHDY
jgi:hypothetical protein